MIKWNSASSIFIWIKDHRFENQWRTIASMIPIRSQKDSTDENCSDIFLLHDSLKIIKVEFLAEFFKIIYRNSIAIFIQNKQQIFPYFFHYSLLHEITRSASRNPVTHSKQIG